MQSVAFTPASAIAAIFAATGQDLGMVGTSSMAHGTGRRVDGGLHVLDPLPRPGGRDGRRRDDAAFRARLARVMGCAGPGKVYRFAQIVAAATLALEISASAAMATAGSRTSSARTTSAAGVADPQRAHELAAAARRAPVPSGSGTGPHREAKGRPEAALRHRLPVVTERQLPGAAAVRGRVELRAPGTIVRPATSTVGRPAPATVPARSRRSASISTPKSVDA